MSAFTPTLRMDVNDDQLREIEALGLTLDEAANDVVQFFRNASVTDNLQMTAENITVIETGQVLKKFRAGVAAIFEIDDLTYLKLTTGDVVALQLCRP